MYYEKLKVIVETLRKELHAFEVPFIIGGLGDFLGKTRFGMKCTEYELVNRELLRFAEEQDNTYFVTAEGLTSNPDGIHVNAISQRKFGVRYYEAFSKRRNVLSPMKNEMELLNQCVNRPHTEGEERHLAMLDFALNKMTYEELVTKVNI